MDPYESRKPNDPRSVCSTIRDICNRENARVALSLTRVAEVASQQSCRPPLLSVEVVLSDDGGGKKSAPGMLKASCAPAVASAIVPAGPVAAPGTADI